MHQVDDLLTLRTYGVEPRCIQTSGVFKLPAELIFNTLTFFGDPHHNILCAKRGPRPILSTELVERLTVIRKLTMTCWHLRNALVPLLWKYTEGCDFHPSTQSRLSHKTLPSNNGLYAQCSYLLLNPRVGAYVQTLSVDLHFGYSPKDLMTTFINCLKRLPNLRTLEVFDTSHLDPITRKLKLSSTRFSSVRELVITNRTAKFVLGCPNVETVVAPRGLYFEGCKILGSYGKELKKLKRVMGVDGSSVRVVAQGCPDLQEIGIVVTNGAATAETSATCLRSLRSLAVVKLEYVTDLFVLGGETEAQARKERRETFLKRWEKSLIPVLKDSPSKERKILRWELFELRRHPDYFHNAVVEVVESGEREVHPEVPLVV